MKKFFTVLSCVIALSFLSVGCSKDDDEDGDGDVEVTTGMTWEKLVEKYPFMGNFPKYEGDIELHQYNKTFGLESVAFFDYKCDASMATEYYAKLASENFFVNPNAEGIYTKTVNDYELIFTGSHAAGNFGMVFSCQPVE